MDLLLFPHSSSSSSASQVVEGLSDVVQKLTQQSQMSESHSSRGAVAIILLLDTVEVTFDVHELEESLASVLRADRRYSVHFDANGRKWNTEPTNSDPTPGAPANAGLSSLDDELEVAKSEISQLQLKLESASREIETLTSSNTMLSKELAEAQSQHDFVRSLYDRASASASSAQSTASDALAKIALLEKQLAAGLALHRTALDAAIAGWKAKVRQLQAETAFARAQKDRTEGEEIRKKASLWDAYQAEERNREKLREERIRANEEKRKRLAAQFGAVDAAGDQGAGLGPFAGPESREREPTPVDEMDELAALAREAAEAGDALPSPPFEAESGASRRSRRSRTRPATTAAPTATRAPEFSSPASATGNLGLRNASNRPPPTATSAAEMALQVEAANLSSANALHDSRQDLEDQFQIFSNTPQPEAEAGMGTEGNQGAQYSMDDFDAVPSSAMRENMFAADAAFEEPSGGAGADGEHGEGWGQVSLVAETDLPPSFTTQSLLLDAPSSFSRGVNGETEEESAESHFRPHTQA